MTAGAGEYAGIFLISMATLMLEILLTRIFSVTLLNHLAFVAVSIAMFGLTVGGVIVYLRPAWFAAPRTRVMLGLTSALFAVAAVWSIDVHLRWAPDAMSAHAAITPLALAYLLSAVPFTFSGIATAVALTKFPAQTHRLYAADLVGAATGCVLLVPALDALGGQRAVLAAAAAGLASAIAFTLGDTARTIARRALLAACIVAAAGITFRLALPRSIRELGFSKHSGRERVLYEKWNSYSRIAVAQPEFAAPFGFGLSTNYTSDARITQLRLNIDSSAETALTTFTGDPRPLEFLKYDVTNVAHHVVRDGRVLVVGAGGGRDVLSALVFGDRHVTAVEMNEAILAAVNGAFGDITGHLDRDPRVTFVNDEARSYLARTADRFDLIQISLIDTWAATAAGAFALTENTLYTVDAWRMFLTRLTDDGILSVSRWHDRVYPEESYKTIALAMETLRRAGVDNPRAHLILVVGGREAPANVGSPHVATLLVKRSAFSEADVSAIEAVARRLAFEVAISPHPASNPAYVALTDPRAVGRFVAAYSADLRPPTDERPFFFSMNGMLLRRLLVFVAALTIVFIAIPVFVRIDTLRPRTDLPLSLIFGALGLGFMLVEIAQMQRLIVLLGHPTFSLSVVLFGLLVASGIGSWCSGAAGDDDAPRTRRLVALLATLAVVGVITPGGVRAFQGSQTPVRVAVALALLTPPAFFMGMAFPIAMRAAAMSRAALTPWLWAINGAASVTASVLAVLLSTRWGIAAAWYVGLGAYAIAIAALVRFTAATRSRRGAPA